MAKREEMVRSKENLPKRRKLPAVFVLQILLCGWSCRLTIKIWCALSETASFGLGGKDRRREMNRPQASVEDKRRGVNGLQAGVQDRRRGVNGLRLFYRTGDEE